MVPSGEVVSFVDSWTQEVLRAAETFKSTLPTPLYFKIKNLWPKEDLLSTMG